GVRSFLTLANQSAFSSQSFHRLHRASDIQFGVQFRDSWRAMPEHDAGHVESKLAANLRRCCMPELVRMPAVGLAPSFQLYGLLLSQPAAPLPQRFTGPLGQRLWRRKRLIASRSDRAA